MLHPIILNNLTEDARTEITDAINEESKKPTDHLEKSKSFYLRVNSKHYLTSQLSRRVN
jgi:hypothetical protein